MTTIERIRNSAGVQSVQRFRCRQLAMRLRSESTAGCGERDGAGAVRSVPLAEPLDWLGHLFVAHREGELIGTVRLNLGREGGLDYYAELLSGLGLSLGQLASVAVISRLEVASGARWAAVAVRLVAQARRHAVEAGATVVLADAQCGEEAVYTGAGFAPLNGLAVAHPYGGPLRLWASGDAVGSPAHGANVPARLPDAADRARDPRRATKSAVASAPASPDRPSRGECDWA